MKGYYKITLQVPHFNYRDGERLITVEAVGRGLLALHRTLNHDGEVSPRERGYTVTHIPSGLAAGDYPGIRKAKQVLEQISDLADWRTVHQTGFTLVERERLREICRADS
jgi:hypothetical protein